MVNELGSEVRKYQPARLSAAWTTLEGCVVSCNTVNFLSIPEIDSTDVLFLQNTF